MAQKFQWSGWSNGAQKINAFGEQFKKNKRMSSGIMDKFISYES